MFEFVLPWQRKITGFISNQRLGKTGIFDCMDGKIHGQQIILGCRLIGKVVFVIGLWSATLLLGCSQMELALGHMTGLPFFCWDYITGRTCCIGPQNKMFCYKFTGSDLA
jgi:hypothetical protein